MKSHHSIPSIMVKFKRPVTLKVVMNMRQANSSYAEGGVQCSTINLENCQVFFFLLQVENISSCDLMISLLGIYPRKIRIYFVLLDWNQRFWDSWNRQIDRSYVYGVYIHTYINFLVLCAERNQKQWHINSNEHTQLLISEYSSP